jgi:GT2 family glycosyltransferase
MRQATPRFSIIIPTRERPRQLQRCLQSLAQLEYPRTSFEVLVVDDGGSSDLQLAVEEGTDLLDVALLHQAQAGPAAARNLGASRSNGEFLAFTDDDCRPEADWLLAMAACFGREPGCAAGGRTLNGCRDNVYSVTSQVIHDAVYRHYNANPQQACFVASNNLAVPAVPFREMGGFDSRHFVFAAEDRDFCDRWLLAGRQLVFAPEARVYHAHALTLRQFVRQHFGYGQGAFHFHQARARRGSGRLRDEFGFHRHLPQLLRPSLAQLPRWQVQLVGMLLLVWQAANACGYAWERLRHARQRHEVEPR